MKISVNFSELQKVLGYTNTILSDKSVDDKMRNVIFMVSKDEVKVVGYNVFTFSRTVLENAEISEDVPENDWEFQIKSNELNKIVGSFSSLYKTKVSKVDFEEEGVRIKVTVHEEPINEEDARLAQDSKFLLENAPILKNIHNEIHMDFPEAADLIDGGDLLMYLDSLFNLMVNDTGNGMTSKLNFADDYVFVITASMSAFMKNELPDAFKDLALTYSSTNFLKKLCEGVENLGVARLDKYICIQSESTEAFMKFQKIKVNYKMFVNKRDKSLGIALDRLYLKDVLKRMGNVSAEGTLSITSEEELQVDNSNFHQVIPLSNAKEGTEGISFKISVPILEKIIVGRDDVFKSDIRIYFVKTGRGYVLYLSDSTGVWFSTTQVTGA